ncbi:sigma-54 dependent transcriptional regulator [Parafrankia sp. BMG5.11]|uniref:sigma-54-dependent transcriptional regulator n=1 Tax=Parafrankia sp. BMG5.11 TaxID=222540 RepID=UPI00103E485E|nr:sigma-54 dependent transcriptional regulator [Parafrankia sp. BMG5.11]TCJ31892.1 sigma-54-dependent Fis family transcriptional regulator [Parafrankia sp. BMG5.11]
MKPNLKQQMLLVQCDDPETNKFVARAASSAGWEVIVRGCPNEVLDHAPTELNSRPTAVVVDGRQEPVAARELVGRFSGSNPSVPSLVLIKAVSPDERAEFLRAGATDCLEFPIEQDRLLKALRIASSPEAGPTELKPIDEQLDISGRFDSLIGADPSFRKVLALAAKVARTHANLVVTGEAGTGKELLLRAVHSASPRCGEAFEVIRVRGVRSSELLSALFGLEAGAQLGAFQRRKGAFERADGGTLLIHEINRLPLEVQEQLATALSGGQIQPLGAKYSFQINVRLLASSTLSLEELLRSGHLCSSLFEVLNSAEIHLPPLRERAVDIPAFARSFLRKINEGGEGPEFTMSEGALALLAAYHWPGNLSQLQAVLFRASATCSGDVLKPEHLQPLLSGSPDSQVAGEVSPPTQGNLIIFSRDGHLRSWEDIEKDVIRLAIGHYGGQMSEVARRLGIGRSTLYRKLEQISLKDEL